MRIHRSRDRRSIPNRPSTDSGSSAGCVPDCPLYLTGCTIRYTADQSGFKEIITSHSIRELGFNGSIAMPPNYEDVFVLGSQRCNENTHPFRDWLVATIPKCTLLSGSIDLYDYDVGTFAWKL